MVVVALLVASCGAVVNRPADEDQLPVAPPVETNEPDDGVLRIRGTLEDSETDTGRPGEVRAYRSNADGTYALLDADTTDAAGNFALSFQDDAEVFVLQARLKDGAADASYVRTLTLPMQSASDLLVRAVPYTGLNGDTVETDITVERFYEFIMEIMVRKFRGTLRKWRNGEPKGIVVLPEYTPTPTPAEDEGGWTSQPGSFTQDQLDAIEEVLRSEEGRALLGGRDVPIQIDGPSIPDSEKHYSYYEHGPGIKIDDGWIAIFASAAAGRVGFAFIISRGDIYKYMSVVLSDNKELLAQREKKEPGFFRYLVLHELGHATFSGHPTLHPRQSIMAIAGSDEPRCLRLCFADRKALKIAFEETFPPEVLLRDVLGQGLHD